MLQRYLPNTKGIDRTLTGSGNGSLWELHQNVIFLFYWLQRHDAQSVQVIKQIERHKKCSQNQHMVSNSAHPFL